MVEAFAFDVAGSILGKISAPVFQELWSCLGVKDDLRRLKSKVSAVQAVLFDAQEKQAINNQLRDWLDKLNDCLHEAEIVLEEFEMEALRRQVFDQSAVLQKAMEVWDLQVIPLDSPVASPAQFHPELENSFICHLQNHCFCIRKVNGEWYNFNSLYPAPEHLSKFSLSAYLATLKSSGWSIFIVRGNFPREFPIASSEGSNSFGQWLLPEDAERMTKSFNNNEQRRQNNSTGVRQEFVNPFATYNEDEDEDLNAAIAASLMDSTSGKVSAEAATSSTHGTAETATSHNENLCIGLEDSSTADIDEIGAGKNIKKNKDE